MKYVFQYLMVAILEKEGSISGGYFRVYILIYMRMSDRLIELRSEKNDG